MYLTLIISISRGGPTVKWVALILKNFQNLAVIPDDAVIDLACLNGSLTVVNRRFVSRMAHRFSPDERFTVAQALLMKVPDFYLANNDPM